jgi:hypothetical protein
MNQADFNDDNRSGLHLSCRILLKGLYPYDNIFEEVIMPDMDLTFDFVIPLRRLIIEVQGQQHYYYIPYFHKNLGGFTKSKERDNQKIEFCRINNFLYIPLSYRDSYEQWREQIIGAYNS